MGETIRGYHERTKHHFQRYARSAGQLDWATQPEPFRRFEGARLVRLPLDFEREPVDYDDLYSRSGRAPAPLTAATLSDFLFHSLAISAWKAMGEVKWELRVNPSSGNLHPTEAYLVLPPVDGVSDAPGLYHYAPKAHGLEERCRLGPGTWGKVSNGLPEGAFLVGLTSVCWREAWKYGERAFRYCQHDTGHAIAAISLAAALNGWRVRVLGGWSQCAVDKLLGVDRDDDFPVSEEREEGETLLLVTPRLCDVDPPTIAPRGTWAGVANRLSKSHHPWPVIDEAAAATRAPGKVLSESRAPMEHLDVSRRGQDARALIRQRRSGVAFDGESAIHVERFVRILTRTLPGVHPPFEALPWRPAIHLALFVHRVDDLAPGLYLLAREASALARLQHAMRDDFTWERPKEVPEELPLFRLALGDCQEIAERLSCGQAIAGASFFSLGMIADFAGPILEHGDWFWRRLFWEAGAVGQVLYLEAEAENARGTGIGCYFDDPVHEMLGLAGHEFQSLYHFTVGVHVEDTRLTTLPAYGV